MLIEKDQIATVLALMIFVFSFSLSIITIEGNEEWLIQKIYNYTIPINSLHPSTPIPQRESGIRSYIQTFEHKIINRYSEKNFDKFKEWGNFTVHYSINEIVMKRIDKVDYPHKKIFYCTYFNPDPITINDCGPMNNSTNQIVSNVIKSSKAFIYYTLLCVFIQMILFSSTIFIKNGILVIIGVRFRFLFIFSTILSYISPTVFSLYFPESTTDPNIINNNNIITNNSSFNNFFFINNNYLIFSNRYIIGPYLKIQYLITILTTSALIIIFYSVALFNQRNNNNNSNINNSLKINIKNNHKIKNKNDNNNNNINRNNKINVNNNTSIYIIDNE